MATLPQLHVSSQSFKDHSRTNHKLKLRRFFRLNPVTFDAISVIGKPNGCRGLFLLPCRSFRSEDGGESIQKQDRDMKKDEGFTRQRSGFLHSVKSVIYKVSGSDSPSGDDRQNFLAKAEELFFTIATQIGRYVLTMISTGVYLQLGFSCQVRGGDSQMNTLIWYGWLGGILIGTMIGANLVLEEHSRAGPRNVVITGSTRGLGKALAREFLFSEDRVVITSRSAESVQTTVVELEENLKECMLNGGGTSRANMKDAKINNAGTNKGFRPLLEFTDEDIGQIVSTNLIGSLICTREAMHVMRSQEKGGNIFNMDGAGSGGSSTPLTAVYGSTKCGLRQLQSSLLKECKRSKVGVHTASPGMVLTDLLLRNSGKDISSSDEGSKVKGTGKAINYLTPPRILLALVTAWLRRGRWFDDQGRALYAAEARSNSKLG